MPTMTRPRVVSPAPLPSGSAASHQATHDLVHKTDSSFAEDSGRASSSANRPEEIPFDFNLFLEQMKLKSAAPVGESVRRYVSTLREKLSVVD